MLRKKKLIVSILDIKCNFDAEMWYILREKLIQQNKYLIALITI